MTHVTGRQLFTLSTTCVKVGQFWPETARISVESILEKNNPAWL